MHLLVIGMDQASSSGWLGDRMSQLGFVMRHADSPEQALRDGLTQGSSAIIVDIGVAAPKASVIVERLRQDGLDHPLIILATYGDWREKVDCLDAGADEYLVKPIRSEEVAARLRAIIRRCAGSATDQIRVGDIELDLKAKCAWRAGVCLDLTRNEFNLLRMFLLRPEQTMSHAEIREQLYPGKGGHSPNAIEVQIARLRRKVGQSRIRTIRGLGYRYNVEAEPYLPSSQHRGPCTAKCVQECTNEMLEAFPDLASGVSPV